MASRLSFSVPFANWASSGSRHYCWRDNVFVERLWKSVKYEEVYLCAYASVSEAKAGLARYLARSTTRAGRTRALTD